VTAEDAAPDDEQQPWLDDLEEQLIDRLTAGSEAV
jgi:hypothetical protein